jgi:hypothetical protein
MRLDSTLHFSSFRPRIHTSATFKTTKAKCVSSTFKILKDKYSAVMTLEQLAETLSRKPEGLRMALIKNEPWAHELNQVKRYIGRRMYFPTETVAALLDGELTKKGKE